MADARTAARVLVTGRVQGVGFRWFTTRAARAEGVAGWVRNLPGGGVELDVEGESGAVERVLEAVRAGPPGARVDAVDVRPRAPEGRADGFDVRR